MGEIDFFQGFRKKKKRESKKTWWWGLPTISFGTICSW